MRHIPLAASAALLAAALAACNDTPTAPGAGRPLAAARAALESDGVEAVWTFADTASRPVWLAYQSGDGAWTRVTPRTAGDTTSFAFSVRDRGGVAVVTRSAAEGEAAYELAVFYGSAEEIATFGRAESAPIAAGTKRLTGSVAGGGMMSQTTVTLGGTMAMVMPMQSTFTMSNVASGPQDLVAALSSFSMDGPEPSIALSKLIIRRGVDLADGAAIPTLDFGGAEAFAPASAALTVEGAAGAQIATSVSYRTAGGGMGLLSAGLGGARYYGVPSAKQVAGDLHMLSVMALPPGEGEEEEEEGELPIGVGAGTADGTRAVLTYFAEARDRTIALGPVLETPAVAALTGGAYPRWRATVARQAEYGSGLVAEFAQDEAHRRVTVTMTEKYAGEGQSWEPAVPDLAAAEGFDAAWGPRAGAPMSWTVSAYGGDFSAAVAASLGIGAAPAEGTQFRFAARAGKGAASIVSAAMRR